MKHKLHQLYRFYYLIFFGLCSCTGCDIQRSDIALSYTMTKSQPVDLTTGKCLVNEIETDISEKNKADLTYLLLSKLKEIVKDSVVFITSAPASHINVKIPFQVSAELIDTLRRQTTYTYLLNVKAMDGGNSAYVDMIIYDLDTRNIIYQQGVEALETEPEFDENATGTFTLSRSTYNLMKNAVQGLLKDLKKGARKFGKSHAG